MWEEGAGEEVQGTLVMCGGGGGGGGGGRTCCDSRVSGHSHACMQELIDMGWCHRTNPFGHPTPRRGKKIARHAHLTSSLSEEGERNIFHLLGVECPGSGMT